MELFKLLGTISISNTAAIEAIDKVTSKAESVCSTLSGKFTSLGEGITTVGKKMSLGLTTPIALIATKAIDAASSFEYAMSEVSAISGATGDDFTALENKAKEMGETTKFSATESAEALKYMAMAGWKTEDMLDGLEGIMNLAAASGEDLGTTSDIVTDALTAFGLSASESGHFADILAQASSNANTNVSMMGETFKYVAPVAGAMGYSAEDVAVAVGTMANSGIKASQAGTALRAILTRLAKPTKESQSAMDELGITITNADGSMKSLYEIMGDMRVGFADLTEAERTECAAKLAGQEAMSGLLAIVSASDEDFAKLTESIYSCEGVTKKMADTMNDNLSGQITLLKSQLEGLAIQFVTLIMPYLRKGVEWLSKICDWIANLDDGTKKIIIVIAALLAAAGPVLIFVGKVVTGIGSVLKVGGFLIKGVGTLITAFLSIPGKAATVVSSVLKVGGLLVKGVSTLMSVFLSIPGKVATVVVKVGGLLVKGVSTLVSAFLSIPAPVLVVIGIVTALVAAGVLLYQNWETVSAWAATAWNSIKETIGNAASAISDFFTGMVEAAKDMKEKVVNKFTELKENVTNKVTELKDNAVNKFTELKDDVTNKVTELKDNAVNKFTELKENVTNKITELKDNAVNKFTELKEKASAKVTELKETAVSKFVEMKDKTVAQIISLKDESINHFNDMKDKAIAGFEQLKAGAIERFTALSSGIKQTLENVQSFVSNAVQKLKGFFNFEWKLPNIKLPHFSIDGSFSLDPPSIPKIGVEWYKNGGIMTEPTAFGFNSGTGKVMVGGEAGAEAIAPIETLKEYVKEAVSDSNYQMYEVVNRILSLLLEYLPQLTRMQLVMDSGALVGELAQPLNEELGRILYMRGRQS